MFKSYVEIIKEYVVNKEYKSIHFTIRTEIYDDSVQYVLDLIEILKQDFSNFDMADVKLVVYGDNYYKGTRGVELTLDKPVEIPDGYVKCKKLEYTL